MCVRIVAAGAQPEAVQAAGPSNGSGSASSGSGSSSHGRRSSSSRTAVVYAGNDETGKEESEEDEADNMAGCATEDACALA